MPSSLLVDTKFNVIDFNFGLFVRLTVETELFRNALNKILSVVDKKNSRPILAYCLISAKEDQLELSATDLEVSAKVILDAKVENPGNFCVNAKTLFEILRELPQSFLTLTTNDDKTSLNITCDDIHYSLLIYRTDDFPHLSFGSAANEFIINSENLLDIISKTSHAISNDETRLYMNGLYLQEVESKLRAVATDGHRLSLLETELNQDNNGLLINGIIIPRKGVFEIKRAAESYPDKQLKISVDESFIFINAEDKYLLSIRLIAREYPKYQAVIPAKTSFALRADRDAFFNAVRRIKIMSNEKSNGVRVTIDQGEMLIAANHPSLGHAQERLQVQYTGKKMEVGFNARYLIDALSVFGTGDIALELNNELSPVLIKSESMPNYLGLIMPLKL